MQSSPCQKRLWAPEKREWRCIKANGSDGPESAGVPSQAQPLAAHFFSPQAAYLPIDAKRVDRADQPTRDKRAGEVEVGLRDDNHDGISKRTLFLGLMAGFAMLTLGSATILGWMALEWSFTSAKDEPKRPGATVGEAAHADSRAGSQEQADDERMLTAPIDVGPLAHGIPCQTLLSRALPDATRLCCTKYGIGCDDQPCEGSPDCDQPDPSDEWDGETIRSSFETTVASVADRSGPRSASIPLSETVTSFQLEAAVVLTTPASPTETTTTDREASLAPDPCGHQCAIGAEGGSDAPITCAESIKWVMQSVYTPGEDLDTADSCMLATNYVTRLCSLCASCSASDEVCQPGTADGADQERTDSLFCFALFIAGSSEESLLIHQLSNQIGLFECDGHALYSNVSKTLKAGDASEAVRVVDVSLQSEYGRVTLDDGTSFDTAFNTPIFVAIWKRVVADGDFRKHGWTIKVDTDTVFLPSRLRSLVGGSDFADAAEGAGMFLLNCKLGLHGPLEVLSRLAMQTWGERHDDCNDPPPEEDVYLQTCLVSLGVQQRDQFDLLAENECRRGDFVATPDWQSCSTGQPAFHPFKNIDDWKGCYNRANDSETGGKVETMRRLSLRLARADAIFT